MLATPYQAMLRGPVRKMEPGLVMNHTAMVGGCTCTYTYTLNRSLANVYLNSFNSELTYCINHSFFFSALDCPDLLPPANGTVDYESKTLSSAATYSCNEGFVIVGEGTRYCLSNTTWSGEVPKCICEL